MVEKWNKADITWGGAVIGTLTLTLLHHTSLLLLSVLLELCVCVCEHSVNVVPLFSLSIALLLPAYVGLISRLISSMTDSSSL